MNKEVSYTDENGRTYTEWYPDRMDSHDVAMMDDNIPYFMMINIGDGPKMYVVWTDEKANVQFAGQDFYEELNTVIEYVDNGTAYPYRIPFVESEFPEDYIQKLKSGDFDGSNS